MKCDNCALAIWKRTRLGSLHPDRSGRCGWKWENPVIPAVFYFITPPHLSGGNIERGQELRQECHIYRELGS